MGIALINEHFQIRRVNQELQKTLNHHPGCVPGADIRKLFATSSQDDFYRLIFNLPEEESASVSPVLIVDGEQQQIFCRLMARRIDMEDGNYVVLFEDISKEIETRQELEYNRQILEKVGTHVWDVVGFAGQDLRFRWISPSVRQYGYEPHEVVGKSIFSYVHPDDLPAIVQATQEAIKNGQPGIAEYRLIKKDGQAVWVETSGNLAYDAHGNISSAVFVTRSIEERKKMEKMLQQQNQELAALNATKDKVFSIIAHDLRSPFSGLLGLTELLVGIDQVNEASEIPKLASAVHQSALRAFNSLNDLLDWARLQRQSIVPKPEQFEAKAVYEQLHKQFEQNLRDKNLTFHMAFSQDLKIFTDPVLLERILWNLLSNAIKFSEKNKAITLRIETENPDRYILSIEDQGIGIPNDMLPELFELSERKQRKGTNNEHSAGLGLIIVKDLVKLLGGSIEVRSEEGKGSTFSLWLPGKNQVPES
ncbi:MAG: PAS domain-containing sensor histidine kinase [Bacteroidetes bacterium]|nr:PAS domain-containing sensor histidine kinase [Bacteroidota bacterium]